MHPTRRVRLPLDSRRLFSLLVVFVFLGTTLLAAHPLPSAGVAVAAPRAEEEETPISRGQPASASSVYHTDAGPILPEFANDGDLETS
jgi:hypothetical protein